MQVEEYKLLDVVQDIEKEIMLSIADLWLATSCVNQGENQKTTPNIM